MGTSGPLPGGTFATDALLGTIDWASAANAAISDNAYATSVLLIGQITRYLKATNFGFNVPLDATITGITVSVERSSTTLNGTNDNSVRLSKAGSVVGSDKAIATLWPTSDATATYGSSTDLWGTTWTPSDINDSGFGVEISAIAALAGTAQIDYISIQVDWVGSNRPQSQSRRVISSDILSQTETVS